MPPTRLVTIPIANTDRPMMFIVSSSPCPDWTANARLERLRTRQGEQYVPRRCSMSSSVNQPQYEHADDHGYAGCPKTPFDPDNREDGQKDKHREATEG
jgi:hypothetical protein